jgi:hypothetical protein
MNRRAFFIFEPLIVLVFLGALLIASNIVLSDKIDKLSNPLGTHAETLATTYTATESDVFIPRELQARYAIEDAIYQLAGSAGQGASAERCQRQGTAAAPASIAVRDIPLLPDIATAMGTLVTKQMNAPVSYVISVDNPLTVTGAPLLPEHVTIPLPKTVEVQLNRGSFLNVYQARVSFTARYNYPLKEMYTRLQTGVVAFDTCRKYPTGSAKSLCVDDILTGLNTKDKGFIAWNGAEGSAPDTYAITATQQYKMPLCFNSPVTAMTLTLPTVSAP